MAILRIRRRGWVLLPLFLAAMAVLSSVTVTQVIHRNVLTETVETGFGNLYLFTDAGEAVLINRARGSASGAYQIKQAATEVRCTEIEHLVFVRYYNQGTYLIASLAAQMRVRMLHLPKPLGESEQAIAARLAQEASLHGIEVVYDAQEYLNRYPTP